MKVTSLKVLAAAALAVTIVGCASKKAVDSTAGDAAAPAPAAAAPAPAPAAASNFTPTPAPATAKPATPVPVAGKPVVAAPSADGFENDAANYTGDTRTRVIYFAFDKSDIPSAAYGTLKAHAKHLAGNSAAKLTMEGHADERGTPEYNVALAERRAKSVVQFLVLNGAKAEQIEVVSFGEEKPAELGHDELSWAKNRRAELVYTAGKP